MVAMITPPEPASPARQDRTRDGQGDVPLSPRDRQTLDALLRGLSEKQVALELGLSRHTVHVYVKRLHAKFGVSSRGELMACWVRLPGAGGGRAGTPRTLDEMIAERNALAAKLATLDQRIAGRLGQLRGLEQRPADARKER